MTSKGRIYFVVYLCGKPVSFGIAKDVDEFEKRRENIECLNKKIRVLTSSPPRRAEVPTGNSLTSPSPGSHRVGSVIGPGQATHQ
jgi:hypothetical protein